MLDVADQQLVVAAVRLPRYVEGVTEKRDGTDDHVQREVDGHAGEGDVGDAAHPGGEDQDARGEASKNVSDGGDEADDAVEAKVDLSAGNAEAVVEQMGE